MKYIASISYGKDSLAMLLKLLELDYPIDYVVFYDTGMEWPAIYKIETTIVNMLKIKYPNIKYIRLGYNQNKTFLYWMLSHDIKTRNKIPKIGYSWCGNRTRWGTAHKIQAIGRFKSSLNDDTVDYVGIALDEPHRFEKAKSEGKLLPLVDWKMTEADCLQCCRTNGYNWNIETTKGTMCLYDLLDRVSCWCCGNKNLDELMNIYLYLPEWWNKLKELDKLNRLPYKGVGVCKLEEKFKKKNTKHGRSWDDISKLI